MTQYPKRLGPERIADTHQALQRRVRLLETRTASIDSGFPLAVLPAVIDPAYPGSGDANAYVNGSTTLTGPYACAAGYVPAPSDIVWVVPVGAQQTYIILGPAGPPDWQPMTLLNGWTTQPAVGYAQYARMGDGTAWVQGKLTAGTLTNGTPIWTAVAGCIPGLVHQQTSALTVESGTGTAGVTTPYVAISSAASLTVQNLPSGLVDCSFSFRYALTT
jgi:hypothetical protein